MPYDPYETQKRVKQEHRNRILSLLSEKPRTFTELQKITRFSPAGLTKMLDDLVKEKEIIKGKKRGEPYETRTAYAKQFMNLENTIAEIVYNDGKYYVDYADHISSGIPPYAPPWGILSHLYIDKKTGKKLNPFSKLDVFDIEKFIFEKIRYNIIHHKIDYDKNKEGKVVLAYEISYKELIKSIEGTSEEDINAYVLERRKEIEVRSR